jgi:hypothetical protein
MMKSALSSLALGALLSLSPVSARADPDNMQEPMKAAIDPLKYKAACPDYKNYVTRQQYVHM